MSQVWKVKIFGFVPRVDDRGRSEPVPFGTYVMREVRPHHYQLSGHALPSFELTRLQVEGHMGLRMSVIEGEWPLPDG